MFDGIDFHEPWIKIKNIFLFQNFQAIKEFTHDGIYKVCDICIFLGGLQ